MKKPDLHPWTASYNTHFRADPTLMQALQLCKLSLQCNFELENNKFVNYDLRRII